MRPRFSTFFPAILPLRARMAFFASFRFSPGRLCLFASLLRRFPFPLRKKPPFISLLLLSVATQSFEWAEPVEAHLSNFSFLPVGCWLRFLSRCRQYSPHAERSPATYCGTHRRWHPPLPHSPFSLSRASSRTPSPSPLPSLAAILLCLRLSHPFPPAYAAHL